MNQDQQIDHLNSTVKCKIAPSSIHGVGVFAIMDIQKGQKIYCHPNPHPYYFNLSYKNLDKLFPEIRELILERWPSIINGSLFLSPNDMGWLATFINHSDNPNYEINTDTAIRNIKKGEEITEDYRLMNNWEKIYPWLHIK